MNDLESKIKEIKEKYGEKPQESFEEQVEKVKAKYGISGKLNSLRDKLKKTLSSKLEKQDGAMAATPPPAPNPVATSIRNAFRGSGDSGSGTGFFSSVANAISNQFSGPSLGEKISNNLNNLKKGDLVNFRPKKLKDLLSTDKQTKIEVQPHPNDVVDLSPEQEAYIKQRFAEARKEHGISPDDYQTVNPNSRDRKIQNALDRQNLKKDDEESPGVKALRERMKQPHRNKPGSQEEKINQALSRQSATNPYAGAAESKRFTQKTDVKPKMSALQRFKDRIANRNAAPESEDRRSVRHPKQDEENRSASERMLTRTRQAGKVVDIEGRKADVYRAVHGDRAYELRQARDAVSENKVSEERIPGTDARVHYHGQDEQGRHHFTSYSSRQRHGFVMSKNEKGKWDVEHVPSHVYDYVVRNQERGTWTPLDIKLAAKDAKASFRWNNRGAKTAGSRVKQSGKFKELVGKQHQSTPYHSKDFDINVTRPWSDGGHNINVRQRHGGREYFTYQYHPEHNVYTYHKYDGRPDADVFQHIVKPSASFKTKHKEGEEPKLMSEEEFSKMKRPLRVVKSERLSKSSAGQYHVNLGIKPVKESTGKFAQWHVSKDDLANILKNWDSVGWDLRGNSRPSSEEKFHSTAISRNKLSTPIESYLKHNKPQGRVLYHGVGRDDIGAKALGAEKYDPFHPDENVRKAPTGNFDEVHSHYTLNVVDKDTGKKILEHIHGLLNDNGKAVISVRRDLGSLKKARVDKDMTISARRIARDERRVTTDKLSSQMTESKGVSKQGKYVRAGMNDKAKSVAVSMLKKAKNTQIKTPASEMVEEHEHLINVLKSPSKKDDAAEAKKQGKELAGYRKALNKAAPEGVNEAKYKRCKEDVAAKQGGSETKPYNVYAVCASSLQKMKKCLQKAHKTAILTD